MAEDRAPPILPTVADVIGAGKARIVAVRPSAKPHINRGRWAIPVTAWQGQFLKARARLAAEVKAAFLRSSEGNALTFLAASNYDTPRATTGAVAAIGSVTLTRRAVHYLPAASLSVSEDDATSFATLGRLLTNIRTVYNTHIASVYSEGTGVGAHANEDTDTMSVPVLTTMGDIVSTLTAYKNKANLHFASPTAFDLINHIQSPHIYGDVTSTIATSAAFASDAGASFGSQTAASQQSAYALANAIKKGINAHLAMRAPAGTIKAGTKIRLAANATAVPPVQGGEYEVSQNTYARTGGTSMTVPVRATAAGTGGNLPVMSPVQALSVSLGGSLYDAAEVTRWVPSGLAAAGGTVGQSDALLRAAAAATWQGIYGPTRYALDAGALRFPGLARCPILRDTTNGASVVYALDESWAQSPEWQASLEQALRTEWLGVGAKLSRGMVVNRVVRVTLSVVLRQKNDLGDTTAITAALESAVRGYFDNRPDFYVFRARALRAVCSRAHKKILKCTSAAVLDADAVPIADPDPPTAGDTLTHWHFAGSLDVVVDVSG